VARISGNVPVVKELRFQASALEDLRALPVEVRRRFGHALWQVQNGEMPANASPFERSTASEVMKLSEQHQGDTYRCVYAAEFPKAVYVLHVFQKKSKSGIATPKKDIDRVYARLARATADSAAAFSAD
jgi:phage-related protein